PPEKPKYLSKKSTDFVPKKAARNRGGTPLRAEVQPASPRMRWDLPCFASTPCQFLMLGLGPTSYRGSGLPRWGESTMGAAPSSPIAERWRESLSRVRPMLVMQFTHQDASEEIRPAR